MATITDHIDRLDQLVAEAVAAAQRATSAMQQASRDTDLSDAGRLRRIAELREQAERALRDVETRAEPVVAALLAAGQTRPLAQPDATAVMLWDSRWRTVLAQTAREQITDAASRVLSEIAGDGDRATFEAAAASLSWVLRHEHRIAAAAVNALIDSARRPLLTPQEREAIAATTAVQEAVARWQAALGALRSAVHQQRMPAVLPLPSGKSLALGQPAPSAAVAG